MLRYEVVNAVKFNNLLYKLLGAVILILNKIRHELQGYRTPRTFSIEKYEKGTNYDIEVVNGWVNCLQEYCDGNFLIGNKCVLELGPGADLGVGLYLLFSGASKYNALDVNNLVGQCPTQFYDFFFKKLILLEPNAETKIKNLRAQLELTRQGKNDRLNYVCSEDFDLNVFEKKRILFKRRGRALMLKRFTAQNTDYDIPTRSKARRCNHTYAVIYCLLIHFKNILEI
jgi:hypothetical protein